MDPINSDRLPLCLVHGHGKIGGFFWGGGGQLQLLKGTGCVTQYEWNAGDDNTFSRNTSSKDGHRYHMSGHLFYGETCPIARSDWILILGIQTKISISTHPPTVVQFFDKKR